MGCGVLYSPAPISPTHGRIGAHRLELGNMARRSRAIPTRIIVCNCPIQTQKTHRKIVDLALRLKRRS